MKPLKPFGLRLEIAGGSRADLPARGEILSLVKEHKLVLIRGLDPLTKEELLGLAADDAEKDLIHWSFGPVMEMKVDPTAQNYLFTREAVPFHWDGAFHEVPSTLVFNCLEAPASEAGGATLFCDSELALLGAREELRRKWEKVTLTYETEKKAHYGGRFSTPMVVRAPDGRPMLRYAEPVETAHNPVRLIVDGWEGGQREFLAETSALLYSEAHTYAHEWRRGDLLFADNLRLLHGRTAFSAASPRHLRRVQLR